MTEMNTAWTAASEEIYKAQSAGAGGQAGGAQPGPDAGPQGNGSANETVTDAEFEEVK